MWSRRIFSVVFEKKYAMVNLIFLSNVSAIDIIMTTYRQEKKSKKVNGSATGDLSSKEDDFNINDLLHEKSKKSIFFMDTHKHQNKMWLTMFDITMNGPLPKKTSKMCWWDHHSFSTAPIGCPLKYFSDQTSALDKERFHEKFTSAGVEFDTIDFFQTEGYFCSFPCVKAYILTQRSNVKYKDSLTLLSLMYTIFHRIPAKAPTEVKSSVIDQISFSVAPSWKILSDHGGHLTIEEYRASFGILEFQETVNTKRPYMFCSSQYISEMKIKQFKNLKD